MWSLNKRREGDSFSCIPMMLNPALTLLSSHLLVTLFIILPFSTTSLRRLPQPIPSSLSLIPLFYTYLSHFLLHL